MEQYNEIKKLACDLASDANLLPDNKQDYAYIASEYSEQIK